MEESTEDEATVSRNLEVLDGELVERLLSISLVALLNLLQGKLGVVSQVQEDTVSGALDFIVSEKAVRLEETESLLNDVRLVGWTLILGIFPVWALLVYQEDSLRTFALGRSWSLELGLQGQNAHVAHLLALEVVET